jgi:cytochrome bd-type quinol oxidase subunit 2
MSVLNPVMDPVRFSTSWLFKANVLCGIRALISLYIFTSIFTILGLRSHLEDRQYFSYFTSLTFWGLAFYFAVAAFHSGTYWRSGKPALAGWPVVLQQLHGIYYTTITVYPYLVTSKPVLRVVAKATC